VSHARQANRGCGRAHPARELYDSVGHALSIVTVQAGAAGRVLDSDPAFARQGLAALETSARNGLRTSTMSSACYATTPLRAHRPPRSPTCSDYSQAPGQPASMSPPN